MALLAGLLAACDTERVEEAASPAAEAPSQIVERMLLRESREGRLQWVLVADTALVFNGEQGTLLRGLRVDFYDAAGESVRSTLTAREGEVGHGHQELRARGTVVVRTREGHMLETEELRWVEELGKVVSEAFVRLTKGESVVTGIGIESDPDLHEYTILSAVQGDLREEDQVQDEF